MKTFTIIAAVDAQGGIGKQGKLPWRLRGDMDYFRTQTVGTHADGRRNAVVMGRKTWNSLPERFRPLPDRLNVVVTHDRSFQPPAGTRVAHDLEAALAEAAQPEVDEIFVIGGASIYQQAIAHPACGRLLLTEIEASHWCDAVFPAIPPAFTRTERSEPLTEDGTKYRFVVYTRSS